MFLEVEYVTPKKVNMVLNFLLKTYVISEKWILEYRIGRSEPLVLPDGSKTEFWTRTAYDVVYCRKIKRGFLLVRR